MLYKEHRIYGKELMINKEFENLIPLSALRLRYVALNYTLHSFTTNNKYHTNWKLDSKLLIKYDSTHSTISNLSSRGFLKLL